MPHEVVEAYINKVIAERLDKGYNRGEAHAYALGVAQVKIEALLYRLSKAAREDELSKMVERTMEVAAA